MPLQRRAQLRNRIVEGVIDLMGMPAAIQGDRDVLGHIIEEQNPPERQAKLLFNMSVDRRAGLAGADEMAGELMGQPMKRKICDLGRVMHDSPVMGVGIGQTCGVYRRKGGSRQGWKDRAPLRG